MPRGRSLRERELLLALLPIRQQELLLLFSMASRAGHNSDRQKYESRSKMCSNSGLTKGK